MSNPLGRRAKEEAVDGVLAGSQYVVSFPGRSQYTAGGGGASACGLAALNCVRVVLGRERDGLKGEELVYSIMGRETMEEILDVCLRWSGGDHLDVDDIHKTPAFSRPLIRERTLFERPGVEQFLGLLSQMKDVSASISVAVITRPPEIIAVLKIPCSSGSEVFVVFDSHPREIHPDGAGLIFNTSADAVADYLYDLFKFDERLLQDESLQWQAQLLANFSAHIFTANKSFDNYSASDAVLDASLAVLSSKAQVVHLASDNSATKAENQHLRDRIEALEVENAELREEIRRLRKQYSSNLHYNSNRGWSNGRSYTQASSHDSGPRKPQSPTTNYTDRYNDLKTGYDQHLHRRPEKHDHRQHEQVDQYLRSQPEPLGKHPERWSPRSPSSCSDEADHQLHVELQRQFEEEDRQLRTQLEDLKTQVPLTFDCGICLSTEAEFMIFRFEPCGHAFCRDCVRGFVQSKIVEHRFPIVCPTCAIAKDVLHPGTINSSLAEGIGLSQEQFALLSELELSTFSVLVHCRKCLGEIFVDKQEYQEAKVVACPLPKCNHAWCKSCSQAIEFAGPLHSCDGSSELDHLMGQRGWKYCPGCKTPTEKMSGCNHMTCMTPGCNMHFCYVCGKSMVQSAKRADVRQAVSQHYRICRLFEDVPDR